MTKMITRTLLAAICCAYAGALSPLAPLQAVGDTSECALYLSGPGRTSAYDYSINLLKGNFGYEGQANCITYEAINQAYLEARNRILVSQPKGDWKAEDFASVGELILDISINLARRYGLTYEEIEKGLPLIDTSRTLIREVCPPVFSHVECRAGKFRRFDGLCNNLQHPTWGATMAPFQRLIGPLFSDGINSPRIAHHGKDLPLSRVVSRTMHPDEGFHDHAGTVMVIAWGQFMDHDYTLTGTPLDPINRNDPEECCKRPLHLKHPYCNEILIPDDDYFYRLFGVKCIDFVRGFPSPRPGCRLGSRVPFNTLTATIDGNTVYGVTEKFARKLRTGFGGLLRMNPVFKEYGLKDLLPLKLDIPDEGCTRPNKNMYCFEAGEIRVNEQLVLTVMHTLMAREHNRVANALAEVNPHWDDETLFQEARRINIAEIQHITYNEFLPILLGKDVMQKFGLVLEKEGYWDGYDPDVNPDVIASFAAAAYRFGHSLLPTAVERWSKAHKFIASKRLSDLIRRPYDLYRAGVLDEYVMGLMNQVAQAMDDSITQEVTNHLFKKVGARFGMDLVSFNMQRGREFGLPGYMEFRKFCGLPNADTFQDLFGSMPNATVQKYETIFDHPIDVDLWSGGVSERPLPGSMLGPTFACIIATQFSYSRRGDRFWFELPNQPSSFTPEQLVEIRKARLARVICDNTDIIDTVQLYPMVLPDHELNPRVPCRSGVIPSMDFSKWAEPAPFRGAAKQFMTNATIAENNSTSDQIKGDNCTENGGHNCSVKALQIDITHCSNNTDCNSTIATENNQENNTETNQVIDKNTVPKYVYKNDNKADILLKQKGHYKNSLKRRKRSVNELQNNSPLPSKFNKPVVVNYETSHGPRQFEPLLSVRNTGNTILGANLADFKIETVHVNPNNKRDENIARNQKSDSTELESLNESNNERDQQRDYKKYENSAEHEDIRRRKTKDDDINSYERQDYKDTPSNNQKGFSGDRKGYKDTSSREIDDRSGQGDYENRPSSHKGSSKPESYRYNQSSRESENSAESDYKNTQATQKERETYKSNESKRGRDDSRERENNRSNPTDSSYSSESDEDSRRINSRYSSPKATSSESVESNENRKPDPKSAESKDSAETDDKDRKTNDEISYINKNSGYVQDNRSYEVSGPANLDVKNKEINTRKNDESASGENSAESKEQKIEERQQNYISDLINHNNKSSPIPIRDIDLSDFSYERIHINDNGKVEPQKENIEEVDPNTAVEILPLSTATPESNIKLLQSQNSAGENTSPNQENDGKLIHINDGEVKPVVEINSENDSGSSEENTKPRLNDEVESLESILGVKEPENLEDSGQNDKIVAQKDEKNGDVKQQFERIPLNYNHNEKNLNKDSQTTETPKTEDTAVTEGTLDVFIPEDFKYDENLNIKFDDLGIKLPDIKLPDDILAYTKGNSPYSDENQKQSQQDVPSYQPSYYYNHDDREEPRGRNRKNNDEDYEDDADDDNEHNRDYYGYHENNEKKQNYKKKAAEEESEEDEDLYEKFVRERFGKRGTFEKRSEKIEAAPLNPELFKTVKNILKKTADIDEQAKKSGDPNAGYMWTLEYGEKL